MQAIRHDSASREAGRGAHAPVTRARPARSPPARSSLLWGLGGFATGVLFWHFVGFWSFVSMIAYNGQGERPAIAERERKPARTVDGAERAAAVAAANGCVDLRLERGKATVTAAACEGALALVKAGPLAGRGDLARSSAQPPAPAPSVAGWATRVQSMPETSGVD